MAKPSGRMAGFATRKTPGKGIHQINLSELTHRMMMHDSENRQRKTGIRIIH